jgi:hypothetical protein
MLLDVNLPQDYERLLELYDVINRR